jgi:hypothetical protein
MRTIIQTSRVSMVVGLALSGCQKAVDQAAPAAEPQATAPAVEPAQATWRASLSCVGRWVPQPGRPLPQGG